MFKCVADIKDRLIDIRVFLDGMRARLDLAQRAITSAMYVYVISHWQNTFLLSSKTACPKQRLLPRHCQSSLGEASSRLTLGSAITNRTTQQGPSQYAVHDEVYMDRCIYALLHNIIMLTDCVHTVNTNIMAWQPPKMVEHEV